MFKRIVLPLTLLAAGGIAVALAVSSVPSPAARQANPCAVRQVNPPAPAPANPCAPRAANPCAPR